jgi:hypothetical protein
MEARQPAGNPAPAWTDEELFARHKRAVDAWLLRPGGRRRGQR